MPRLRRSGSSARLIPRALALRQRQADFIAPELIVAEISNAAWRKQVRNEIDADTAAFAAREAPLLFE